MSLDETIKDVIRDLENLKSGKSTKDSVDRADVPFQHSVSASAIDVRTVEMPTRYYVSQANRVTDYSTYGNHGTPGGASPPTTVVGRFGMALAFSGESKVGVPHSASLALGSTMTISTYLKKELDWDGQTVLLKTGGDYKLFFDAAGKVQASIKIAGVIYSSPKSNSALANGQWYHVVVMYDGAKLHLYVDTVEQGTGTNVTGTIDNGAGGLGIGNAY